MNEKNNTLFKHIVTVILVLSLLAGVIGMNVWLFKDKKVTIENKNTVVEQPSNNNTDSGSTGSADSQSSNGQSQSADQGGTTQGSGTNTQSGNITTNTPSVTVNNNEGKLLLSLSEPMNAPPGAAIASYNITATVLPSTAKNKKVTWSIAWGDATHAGTVTDYVSVTPASEGSTTATVACYQSFTGNVIVTCTTVENGFQASCIVTYEGKPTEITLSGLTSTGTNTFGVNPNSTYAITVNLSNAFNSVGTKFNNITCSVTGIGSFQTANQEYYNQTGTHLWYDSALVTKNVADLINNFMTVSISGNTITLTTLKSIEGYYESMSKIDGGRTNYYTNKYYSGVENCSFKLTVSEAVSGLSKDFIINFDNTLVTGLSLSPTTLIF